MEYSNNNKSTHTQRYTNQKQLPQFVYIYIYIYTYVYIYKYIYVHIHVYTMHDIATTTTVSTLNATDMGNSYHELHTYSHINIYVYIQEEG